MRTHLGSVICNANYDTEPNLGTKLIYWYPKYPTKILPAFEFRITPTPTQQILQNSFGLFFYLRYGVY